MENLSKFKIEKAALKIFIFGIGVGFTLYCGLLCLGIRHSIAEFVSMTGAYILLGIAASMYRLCWISWLFIIYTYLIRCCMIAQEMDLFGDYLDIAHYIALSVGVVLCLILVIHIHKKGINHD